MNKEVTIDIENHKDNDLISRQAALDLIADYDLSMGQVVRGIHDLPSVKPQESKTGHWITLKDEYGDVHEAICSNCDSNGNYKWTYCPNCGTKMKGGQNG